LQERRTLFGRRKGKPLSARRETVLARVLDARAIDLSRPPPAPLEALFPRAVDAIRLEIGFGGAEHLMHEAQGAPDIGFIGVEPFVEGMAKAAAAIDETGLDTIRLFDRDAAELLGWLPASTIERVDLLYPDPWPKRRHWKRRFVSAENLDLVAKVLKPGGTFRFASDIESYVAWTLAHAGRHPDLEWTAEQADDWRLPFPGWPGTRYEAKALREGRRPTYLEFRRL